MCAAWSGQRSAVRLLLRHGAAWVGVVDTQGRDAQDLALEGIFNRSNSYSRVYLSPCKHELVLFSLVISAGHREVLEELMNNGRSPERESSADDRLD